MGTPQRELVSGAGRGEDSTRPQATRPAPTCPTHPPRAHSRGLARPRSGRKSADKSNQQHHRPGHEEREGRHRSLEKIAVLTDTVRDVTRESRHTVLETSLTSTFLRHGNVLSDGYRAESGQCPRPPASDLVVPEFGGGVRVVEEVSYTAQGHPGLCRAGHGHVTVDLV